VLRYEYDANKRSHGGWSCKPMIQTLECTIVKVNLLAHFLSCVTVQRRKVTRMRMRPQIRVKALRNKATNREGAEFNKADILKDY